MWTVRSLPVSTVDTPIAVTTNVPVAGNKGKRGPCYFLGGSGYLDICRSTYVVCESTALISFYHRTRSSEAVSGHHATTACSAPTATNTEAIKEHSLHRNEEGGSVL